MIREKAIPFEIRKDILNATTLAAIAEVEEMEKQRSFKNTSKVIDIFTDDYMKDGCNLNTKQKR